MVEIDNIEQVKELLLNIENLFLNLDDKKKQLEHEIYNKEGEQDDWLHEIELGNLNGFELPKVARQLKQTRKERRILKNKLEIINTLKGFTDEYIKKGIIANVRQAITNIDTLKNNQDNRTYVPRIIKDLKCARKKEEK